MADKKISQLSAAATPLAGTEVLPIVQSSATVKVSIDNLTAGKSVSASNFVPTGTTVPANGMFLSSANSVGFATNTTEHWVVNASGNFNPVGSKGIGTSLAPVNGVVSTTLQSTVATGTAPLTVASTTEVANLRAANATSADTSNAVKSNATTGVMQITGPAAAATRVMTIPDANFTAARTDAAQTFTGVQSFSSNVTKNMAAAGTSGSPTGESILIYNLNGNNRGSIKGWNIAQNNDSRTWWSIVGTNDVGAEIELLTATVYSDIYVGNHFRPAANNAYTLGNGTYRWSEVYAINGTINTSDANAKTQIEDLSDAELRVAKSLKGLIKKFKYKDAVAKKGDSARIHIGVIAQSVRDAFANEGLDAEKYGMFCKDEHYAVNGEPVQPDFNGAYPADAVKVEQLGIRYDQLLAFVVAAL